MMVCSAGSLGLPSPRTKSCQRSSPQVHRVSHFVSPLLRSLGPPSWGLGRTTFMWLGGPSLKQGQGGGFMYWRHKPCPNNIGMAEHQHAVGMLAIPLPPALASLAVRSVSSLAGLKDTLEKGARNRLRAGASTRGIRVSSASTWNISMPEKPSRVSEVG